jgi:nucleoside-diphosphate-sugar epimerase
VATRLVLLGVGMVARAVARAAESGRAVIGTTRSPARAGELARLGLEPYVVERLSADVVAPLAEGSDLLVSFPPDGATDAAVAPACGAARAIVYVSSTAVYGDRRGTVDDATPVDLSSPRAAARLEAEAAWRAVGAVVLRAPGIYGPESGLHVRLREGGYRLAGDGSNVISRIHVDDLAALALAALDRGRRGETYVVGDLAPVPQIEVVRWLVDRLGIPMPGSAPPEALHPTLRGSRAVDPSRALSDLGVTLRYPTYREGFAAALRA